MRSFTLVAAATAAVAVTPLSSVHRQNTLPSRTGRVIVELEQSTSTSSFVNAHSSFFDHLDRRGIDWVTNHKYESDVFTGVAVTLANADDVAHLEGLDVVKSVTPVRPFDAPRVFGKHVLSGPNDANAPAGDPDSTHKMTGVDKLHAQGLFGKGIKIGILDTGVDYTHPNLGNGKFGPGGVIVGGRDLVGDNYNGSNTPVPDADPLDQCAGHGTHVSGIIAAQPGNDFNVSGVAYEAAVSMYRIFGCTGSTADDVIVQGLLDAYKDGNDVISLSLGGADGWTESASSVVASRIARKGKVVTIAAGNDGQYGAWYTSSPGNGLDVISVSSIDNTEAVYQSLKVSGADIAPIPYLTDGSIHPVNISGEWPVYAVSKDSAVADDACNPLPDSTPDLSKYITLVRRGTCNFSQKLANVAAKGAQYAVVYNNGGTFAPVVFGNDTTAVLIDTDAGAAILEQVNKGVAVTISFPQVGAVTHEASATGGLVSDFTSFGPSNDMYFKPAVAAPGGNIVNTWPVPLGSFVSISGTSMATPHTAGAAALILQAKGKKVATSVRTLLQTTAQTVAADKEDGAPPQTLSQQGAGLINVFNAIHYTTAVTPGELLLNDTANWKGRHTFTVKNNGNKKTTYRLTHVPAGTLISLQEDFPIPADYPVPQTDDKVTAKLSASSVTLAPGKSAQVTVTFTPPKNIASAAQLPVLSGFIQIVGGGETLKVSYLGLAASLKTAAVIDGSAFYFGTRTPLLMNNTMQEQTEVTEYTLQDGDAPTLLFRMAMGTPSLVVDLVPADTHIHVTLNPPKYFVNPKAAVAAGSFDSVKTVGRVGSIPYMSRDNDSADTGYSSISLASTFEDGTPVAPGTYRLLIRALKITGDATKQEDYETYMSPTFKVVAA